MDNGKLMYAPHKISRATFKPLLDHIIVHEMKFEERRSSGGIIIPNDDMKNSGIRPRWAQVYAIGPDQKDVQIGQWVLVNHGRWTRGVKVEDEEGQKTIRRVDNDDILLVSDEPVFDEIMGDKTI